MSDGLTRPVHEELHDRIRRGQTLGQLTAVGDRTGWWDAADVDWAFDGDGGPRPDKAIPEAPVGDQVDDDVPPAVEVVQPPPAADLQPDDQADDVPAPAADVVHPSRPRDLLAEGLAHPDPAIAAAAEKARRAVDHLTTLLMRRPAARRATPRQHPGGTP